MAIFLFLAKIECIVGIFSSIEINVCDPNPCHNGGNCTVDENGEGDTTGNMSFSRQEDTMRSSRESPLNGTRSPLLST